MSDSSSTHAYDYYGLIASTWDLWRDDTSNWSDRFFFLEIVQRYGQPVLDVGCGTGRIILDYFQQGIDIDGVDNSPEMLDICRTKAEKLKIVPKLYQQDMQKLDLPRTYRTILCPSSSLQLLTDLDEARAALRRFFDHLEPGGAFISPFSFDWQEGEPLEHDWRLKFEKPRPEDGAVVRSWTREWYELAKQWWHYEERFEVELNGEIIAREHHRHSPDGRWYTQAQAIQLYQEVGFANIQLFKLFEDAPVTPEDRSFCVLGVKP
ncbi:MAG TPA: class I SAM-dependent methyltransferase [Phototrophicaceae bacterium]|jgi:ubiquinone/menaquinone biosynthesis C-methylase UbiE|nr:class I SAM-dependent methyltransferase [Phototrophicaceae bacterium]